MCLSSSLVVHVVTVVVSATMVTLFSDVLTVAMIAAPFFALQWLHGETSSPFQPRCFTCVPPLSFIQLSFSKILAVFRRVRKIAKSDY